MPLSTLADAQTYERGGVTFRSLAASALGSSELALWSVEIGPGVVSEPHTVDREEIFVVVAGAVSVSLGGEELEAKAGDAVIVPAHTMLQLRNGCPDKPATITAVTSVGMTATIDGTTFAPPWAQ